MERLARKITNLIQQSHPRFSELDIKIIKFGLECIIGEGSKFFIYLIFFSLFSLTKEYLVAFVFFGMIRLVAGGYHENTYLRCFITSFLIFSCILAIGCYVYLSFWTYIFISITSVILMIFYAPVDHPNKPILSDARRMKFKKLSISITILFIAIGFFLPGNYAKIALISIFIESLSLPAGVYMKRRMLYEGAKG